jgi:hypothetical protein
MPRARPPSAPAVATAPAADKTQSEANAPNAAPETPSACRQRLTPDLAVVHPLPAITGPGACQATDVVRLEAVFAKDARKITIDPAAVLRCGMAEAVVHWLREEAAPAAAQRGAPLAAVTTAASFECRGRNRVTGAKLSQHGLANALDLRALKLADGQVLGLTDAEAPKDVRLRLHDSACARFSTVLGPGSDGYHEDHVHIDLIERRSGYRICQWELREPGEAPVASAPVHLLPALLLHQDGDAFGTTAPQPSARLPAHAEGSASCGANRECPRAASPRPVPAPRHAAAPRSAARPAAVRE